MKKAWDEIKSFVTVTMTLAYIGLTFLGQMTAEFQTIYLTIIAFYFGTQFEKSKNSVTENYEDYIDLATSGEEMLEDEDEVE